MLINVNKNVLRIISKSNKTDRKAVNDAIFMLAWALQKKEDENTVVGAWNKETGVFTEAVLDGLGGA